MANTLGRVYKRGRIWWIDYGVGECLSKEVKPDGSIKYKYRRYRKPIGEDKKLAQLALSKIHTEIAEGKAGIEIPARKKFSEFVDEYLELYSPANKDSHHKDELNIMILKKNFGDKYLTDVTTLDVRRFFKKGEDIPISTNRRLALLKSIFNRAIEGRLLVFNPCKGVKKYKEHPRFRYLEYDEIERLLANSSGMIKAIITTAIYTGLRKNELLGLTWKDCDFDRRLIHLTKTKNDEPRYVAMCNKVYKTINAIPKHPESPYIFYKKDGRRYMGIRKSFDKLLATCGIINFHFHDLRHCFASLLRMGGTDLEVIGALLGHKSLGMTQRYSHLSPDYMLKAVECLDTISAQLKFKQKNKTMDLSQFFVNKGVT